MKNLFIFISVYIITISIVIFSYVSVHTEKVEELSFTQSELDGIIYLKDIYRLSISTALYQGDLTFEDDKSIIKHSKNKIKKHIDLIMLHQGQFPQFKNNEFNKNIHNLKNLTIEDDDKFYEFLDYINHENYRIGDISKILFEEDRKSYFLGALITHYMPEYLISTISSHNIVEELLRNGSISDSKRDIFTEQNKLMYLSSEEISEIIKLLKEYDDTKILSRIIKDIEKVLEKTPNNIIQIQNNSELAQDYIKNTHQILNLLYNLNDENIKILENTLSKRKDSIEKTILAYHITLILISIIISIIMYLFYRSYSTNIKNLFKLENEKDKTQKALEFKSQFLSNMSHEIRTPLNSIISLSNLTLKTKLDEKQKYMLEKVNAASSILLGVINDILDISKIESGKMTIEKEPLDIKECGKNIYDMLLIKAQENGISLEINYENISHSYFLGDSLRISQILTNLINNAIKFTHHGGVTIKIKKLDEDRFRFEVKDTGIGLKEDQLSTLFEEFTQADMSTSRKYGGTGLGLSISKNLVEMMDGKIWVESVYGKGSTFIFEIPLEADLSAKNNAINEANDMQKITAEIDEKEDVKILVAEDNKMNQMVLKMLLEDSKIELDFADDGQIAIDKFNTNNYDMILMDIQMPNINGFEATSSIRKSDANITIVGLSANAMQEDIQKAMKCGMNDYLTKPIDIDKLYTALHKYL